jgi:hypothetical protein
MPPQTSFQFRIFRPEKAASAASSRMSDSGSIDPVQPWFDNGGAK